MLTFSLVNIEFLLDPQEIRDYLNIYSLTDELNVIVSRINRIINIILLILEYRQYRYAMRLEKFPKFKMKKNIF
jgi:hypothetical protein